MSASSHAQDRVLPSLVAKGIITQDDADRATRLAAADRTGHSATYHLMKLGTLQEPIALIKELAAEFNVKGVDLSRIKIDEAVLKMLPKEMVLEHRVVPVSRQDRKLYVAMADPTDLDTVDRIKFATNLQIVTVVADEYTLDTFIESRYNKSATIDAFLSELASDDDEQETVEVVDDTEVTAIALQEEIEAAPVVKLINHTLNDAVKRGASDIHFEFFEHETRIRYRIDGSLVTVAKPPKKFDRALISRLKVISKLNISERRIPQDGRTKFRVNNRVVDFRVSTLPTQFGEKIVLRILDKSAVALDLQALGIEEGEQELILKAIKSPFGMVVVTGPTGSGKTTTLYSMLQTLNEDDVNIMTVEDPVEYDFPGINQTAVHTGIGMTFEAAIRAFLRQDPDIIMVGEMRDRETAEIGIRAALTGHLVLSTMHTNDSASAITRMEQMGIDRFNIAAAAKLIIAQRLVRKLCPRCKVPTKPDPMLCKFAGLDAKRATAMTFYRGRGCDYCNHTGYKGRQGLYEVLPISAEISELIINGSSDKEIKQRAIVNGMQTLHAAGLRKVEAGITTLDEVVKRTLM